MADFYLDLTKMNYLYARVGRGRAAGKHPVVVNGLVVEGVPGKKITFNDFLMTFNDLKWPLMTLSVLLMTLSDL